MLEIDFAGSKLNYVDPDSGEVIECPVLVGVLPLSGYCFLQTLPDKALPNVINGLNNMLAYFQGAPLNIISDNMKLDIPLHSTPRFRYKVSVMSDPGLSVKFVGFFQDITLIELFTDQFPIKTVIEIKVMSVDRIQAPSYFLYPDTTEQNQVENAMRTYKVIPSERQE